MRLATLGALCAVALLAACKEERRQPVVFPQPLPQAPPQAPAPQPVATTPWQLQHSACTPDYMPIHPAGGYEFDFPVKTNALCKPGHAGLGVVGYVTKAAEAPLRVGQTITLRFALQGEGTLEPNRTNGETGAGPAAVTLYFQRAGDTLHAIPGSTTLAQQPDHRWWAWASHTTLVSPGEYEVTAKIDPENWANVEGSSATKDAERTAGFLAALADVSRIGMTFGDGYFGHGVYLQSGAVKFVLREYRID